MYTKPSSTLKTLLFAHKLTLLAASEIKNNLYVMSTECEYQKGSRDYRILYTTQFNKTLLKQSSYATWKY